jgi:hypothetical protein
MRPSCVGNGEPYIEGLEDASFHLIAILSMCFKIVNSRFTVVGERLKRLFSFPFLCHPGSNVSKVPAAKVLFQFLMEYFSRE